MNYEVEFIKGYSPVVTNVVKRIVLLLCSSNNPINIRNHSTYTENRSLSYVGYGSNASGISVSAVSTDFLKLSMSESTMD